MLLDLLEKIIVLIIIALTIWQELRHKLNHGTFRLDPKDHEKKLERDMINEINHILKNHSPHVFEGYEVGIQLKKKPGKSSS